jgi:4-amino-4-deoxy-L-arabinose transferase-like glycosyltransferase
MLPLVISRLLKNWAAPASIVLLGLALRLYGLDHQSVWSDEAVSIAIGSWPLSEITARLVSALRPYPPLYFYFLHSWFAVLGYGAFEARLLSMVFGTLSIIMTFLLARYLFGRQTGLLAALLLAVSQLGIIYSQEAGAYSQLLFLALTSTYCFIRALRERSAWRWWCFVASTVALAYTHYYGLFVLVCLLAFAVAFRKRYVVPRVWWVAGFLVVLACYAPWLLSGAVQGAAGIRFAWPAAQRSSISVHWSSFFSAVNWFNNGKVFGVNEPSPWWTFLAGGLLFTLPGFFALRPLFGDSQGRAKGKDHLEALVLVNLLWIVPALLVLAVGAVRDVYNVRYLAHCCAPYYMMVACGIASIRSSILRRSVVILMLTYSMVSLRAVHFIPYKENNRDALAYLVANYRAGDCCIFQPQSPSPYWHVYHRDHPGVKVVDFDTPLSGETGCERVWLVWDGTWWKNVGSSPRSGGGRQAQGTRSVTEAKRLLEESYSRIDQQQYYRAEVTLYERCLQPSRVTSKPIRRPICSMGWRYSP